MGELPMDIVVDTERFRGREVDNDPKLTQSLFGYRSHASLRSVSMRLEGGGPS